MAQDKPLVLYVDDLPMNLKLFEAAFKKDYDLILTESPLQALEIMGDREIQVLVSDQRMPEMSGTELLERVSRQWPDVRRFLLTAFTDTETVIEAINVGRVHGYIKKPMDAAEVRRSINHSLEAYYLRKRNREILTELESVNSELRNMDGLKSEIIQSLTSEISTPLNRIMGTLHLLKSKIEGDELTEVVNILDHSVFKLEQFSHLTRQISMLKSPDFKLQKRSLSLKQVIQFGYIETSEELKEQGILLRRKEFSEELQIKGDSDLLVSCLVSLIRFARDHTDMNGELAVDAYHRDYQVFCKVEDQGVNYSETLLDLLSSQFSGKDVPMNLSMGIGLAVSQMIMEAHGGCLMFEKGNDRRGQFIMAFPHE